MSVDQMETLVSLEFLGRKVLRGSQGLAVLVKLEKRAVLADQDSLELLDHLVAKENQDRA